MATEFAITFAYNFSRWHAFSRQCFRCLEAQKAQSRNGIENYRLEALRHSYQILIQILAVPKMIVLNFLL
ncbi:MAG: hypothetical protein BRC51_15615 [Cyanobacteria bacterium SW_12_48_29]|nr:MAG: hypothetical protein BRC44_04340 [Cyanobacteria bacterium QS_4_48_99]PSO98128.1 MAG: hypothetical protein BRC51_15615 [Cyanobacteria bacterium SW_12_48_29]PSP23726.1 MAG: hypothetical protein BRC52_01555 [Cyanobacteria bacterium SW_5_48_44]